MFPIHPVKGSSGLSSEQLGTKPKFWVDDDEGNAWLFKADDRGCGDDWAEKVVSEIAGALGIPRVSYELAHDIDRDIPGVVSPNMRTAGAQLVHGDQLLLGIDPDYPSGEFRVQDHTVAAVVEVVSNLEPPTIDWSGGLPSNVGSALDVFLGYLILDVLVGNQDRHHQNWGALEIDGILHLAPTFDHGSSLARNLGDAERIDRLRSKDAGRRIPKFASRARSKLFRKAGDRRSLTTMEAWRVAASTANRASSPWLQRLQSLDRRALKGILDEVPPQRMTLVCREFTLELLLENQRRLLAPENEP